MDDATAQAMSSLLQQRIQQLQQLQQQQQQLHRPPSSLMNLALDRQSNAQAQALLLHHEECLRATRLLLEQQQHLANSSLLDTNMHHRSLLLATDAMAAAKVAQQSILGEGGGNSNNTGMSQLFHSTSDASASTNTKISASLAGQKGEASPFASSDNQALEPGVVAASVLHAESSEENQNQTIAGDSDEDTDFHGNDNEDDDEGYDDKLSDETYFENFSTQDDNRVIQETFPLKLYRMLFEVEKINKQNIVSFLPHGKSFVVHKPKAFVEVCH
jgi:hypothetical protein